MNTNSPSDIEQKVLNIFSIVLDKPVQLSDNFYSLGGDSIELSDIGLRLNKMFNLNFTRKELLNMSGNIGEYCEKIQNII
jgi:acyl carrier protein